MSLKKRKLETTSPIIENTFLIQKMNSLLSIETSDSLSKEDNMLSPLVLKSQDSEVSLTSEYQKKLAQDKLSALKSTANGKKNKRSTHLNSYEEIKRNYMSDPMDYIDNYRAVKYKNYKYLLGTCLLVKNEADADNDFICKLIKIIKPKKVDSKKILAFLEVQW